MKPTRTSPTGSPLVVITTIDSLARARKLARTILEAKQAACVNILPKAESVYRWKGKIERSDEWVLLIKTTRSRFKTLTQLVMKLHPYDLPEWIALPITLSSPAYKRWLSTSVT